MSTPSIWQGRPKDLNTVGTVPESARANGVTVTECGGTDGYRQTVFKFTNMVITITDALAYASQQIYDFPAGRIHIKDCVARITPTTTSTIASTLNSGATVSWGIGTAAATSETLATTMMNAMPGSGESVNNFTSSTTINVAAAADTGFLAAVSAAYLAAWIDGTSTAADLYFNLGVPTTTQIDGDATVSITGHAILTWINCGITTALTE